MSIISENDYFRRETNEERSDEEDRNIDLISLLKSLSPSSYLSIVVLENFNSIAPTNVIDTFFLFSCLCFRLYFLYRPNLLLSTVLFVSDFECRFSFLLHYLSLHNFVSVISSSNRFITCTSGASKYDAKISSKIGRSADCKDNRPKK